MRGTPVVKRSVTLAVPVAVLSVPAVSVAVPVAALAVSTVSVVTALVATLGLNLVAVLFARLRARRVRERRNGGRRRRSSQLVARHCSEDRRCSGRGRRGRGIRSRCGGR